jgi:asparagine synthase (glutamine-hydrolysing)
MLKLATASPNAPTPTCAAGRSGGGGRDEGAENGGFPSTGFISPMLLIRALSRHLPGEILTRRKQGFSIPLSAWLRTSLRDLVHSYLCGSAVRGIGLFDPKAVARILAEHDQLVRNQETRIWALLMLMMWHDRYMRNRSLGVR